MLTPGCAIFGLHASVGGGDGLLLLVQVAVLQGADGVLVGVEIARHGAACGRVQFARRSSQSGAFRQVRLRGNQHLQVDAVEVLQARREHRAGVDEDVVGVQLAAQEVSETAGAGDNDLHASTDDVAGPMRAHPGGAIIAGEGGGQGCVGRIHAHDPPAVRGQGGGDLEDEVSGAAASTDGSEEDHPRAAVPSGADAGDARVRAGERGVVRQGVAEIDVRRRREQGDPAERVAPAGHFSLDAGLNLASIDTVASIPKLQALLRESLQEGTPVISDSRHRHSALADTIRQAAADIANLAERSKPKR
ncbi:hypothetical protein AB0F17_34670 [Nonomuraea sp. NPDC026600]|uniref:hypothetical protein n=1 Tax=Nonomuraea sp. NPDC026600 TaxID=3155363 RepID=UPI003409054F